MKFVKEYLNEKFEAESDPIRDLGIGGIIISDIRDRYRKRYKNDYERGRNLWGKRFRKMCKNKKITGIFEVEGKKTPRITVFCENVYSGEFGKTMSIKSKEEAIWYHIIEKEAYVIR